MNYGIGSFVPQLVGFFLIPLYTSYILPKEMGMIEIATTLQTLLVLFMRSGIAGGISRYYFDSGETQNLKDYMATTAITGFCISAVILALALIFGPALMAKMFPDIPFHPFIDFSILTAFFQIAPDWQRRLIQAREQSAFSAKLTIVSGLVGVILNIFFVVGLRMGGEGMIYASLSTAAIFFVYAIFCLTKDLRGRFKLEHLKYSLSYGLPLVPHHIAAWGQQFLGRWVLSAVATLEAIGHLSIASRLVSPILIIIGAFASSYSPVYFSWRSKGTREQVLHKTQAVFNAVVILGAWMVISIAIFGDLFVRYFLDISYRPAAPVIGILAIWAWSHFIYTVITAEIFYSKKTTYISSIFILSTSVNLGLVYIIGKYGPAAAAIAQMIGGFVSVGITAWVAQKEFPLPFDYKILASALIAVLLTAVYPFLIPSNQVWRDSALGTSVWLIISIFLLFWSGAYFQFKALLKSLSSA